MASELSTFKRVLREEADAILALIDAPTTEFERAVEWIFASSGRVITCGVGKSGHIARKVAGTLASTGTPSHFLHAAEAVHGDLGMITDQDIVLAYSHSGETDEIVKLFPSFQAIGARTILITGRPNSSAGRLAALVLDTGVTREACSINLAPTTSTTAMLALSDALAIEVMDRRGFKQEDFAKFHPAGALGKRLLLAVSDVMRTGDENAVVFESAPILEVLKAITNARAGAACVVDGDGKMVGFLSDGDIRRHFLGSSDPFGAAANQIMSTKFSTISSDLLAIEALEMFENLQNKIGEIPVLDSEGKPIGMLVLKDLLRSGIV